MQNLLSAIAAFRSALELILLITRGAVYLTKLIVWNWTTKKIFSLGKKVNKKNKSSLDWTKIVNTKL